MLVIQIITYEIAIIAGTTSITYKAIFIPNLCKIVYERAPAIPAAPVPDDQVETTFLKHKMYTSL